MAVSKIAKPLTEERKMDSMAASGCHKIISEKPYRRGSVGLSASLRVTHPVTVRGSLELAVYREGQIAQG